MAYDLKITPNEAKRLMAESLLGRHIDDMCDLFLIIFEQQRIILCQRHSNSHRVTTSLDTMRSCPLLTFIRIKYGTGKLCMQAFSVQYLYHGMLLLKPFGTYFQKTLFFDRKTQYFLFENFNLVFQIRNLVFSFNTK